MTGRRPTSASRWRLVAPALAAAVLPLAVRAVAWGGGVAPAPGAVVGQAAWVAAPFAFLGGLAAVEPRVRPAFALASAVGLALTAAGWAWLAAAGPGAEATLGGGIVAWTLPIGVLSVMITVVAVRSAFSGPPPPARRR